MADEKFFSEAGVLADTASVLKASVADFLYVVDAGD
jgi:hypothetical protein